MPAKTQTPSNEDFFEAMENANEVWAVVGMGGICFRYGPYTPKEAGVLMNKAIAEGVGTTFVIQCGKDIDWALMKQIAPATYGETDADDPASK